MVAYRYFLHRTITYSKIMIALGSILIYTHTTCAKPNWFSRHKHKTEELIELKPKKNTSSFSIEHTLPGSVHLQGWNQNHIAVTLRKHSTVDDDLERIRATLTQTDHGVITLHVEEAEDLRKHAKADITVHMPKNIATTLITQEDVHIEQTHNAIRVETEQGSIDTQDTHGALHLETKKGDITCADVHGSLAAYTDRGDITITESYGSIKADTKYGALTVSCARIPSTAFIDLNSHKRGIITLTVPESAQAHLVADTTRGTITSNVLITLERQTTVLNAGTYQDSQRHIRGTIGQQGTAEIRLTGTRDIHITIAE